MFEWLKGMIPRMKKDESEPTPEAVAAFDQMDDRVRERKEREETKASLDEVLARKREANAAKMNVDTVADPGALAALLAEQGRGDPTAQGTTRSKEFDAMCEEIDDLIHPEPEADQGTPEPITITAEIKPWRVAIALFFFKLAIRVLYGVWLDTEQLVNAQFSILDVTPEEPEDGAEDPEVDEPANEYKTEIAEMDYRSARDARQQLEQRDLNETERRLIESAQAEEALDPLAWRDAAKKAMEDPEEQARVLEEIRLSQLSPAMDEDCSQPDDALVQGKTPGAQAVNEPYDPGKTEAKLGRPLTQTDLDILDQCPEYGER